MFEDNYYEPLAEIYLTLSGPPSVDGIYCLYSRVFVDGANKFDEEVLEEVVEEEAEEPPKTGQSGENSVRFGNSFTESQPLQTPKKNHDEIVSCYCSASHYSTDEHDSLRDSVLQHSDSGADLSESSRDLDWDRYWTLHGEGLIWESWISKYGTYIDPSYNSNKPAEGDDTSFFIREGDVLDQNKTTSFLGLIDRNTTENNGLGGLYDQQRLVEHVKLEHENPKILVEIVETEERDEIPRRRLSEISETAKSVSERSEESVNFDDSDRLRLSVHSRCSGSSAPLSGTNDSMTNVTRMTLSSSDSSYGIDDSSAKSSSILTSSDSANSVDQQWQLLWADHFNEQYNYHYSIFTDRYKKEREENKNVSGLIIDDSKTTQGKHCDPHHQESIDKVASIETTYSVSESDLSRSLTSSSKLISKSKSKRISHKQRMLSVGYLLQQLNTMSVESKGRIEEEENIQLCRPSIMEGDKVSVTPSLTAGGVNGHMALKDSPIETGRHCERTDNNADTHEHETVILEDIEMARHGVKRSHESENCKSSVEKIKSAYQLMGLMYDLEHSTKIRKASVCYKKRFSQIRFQNRILRLQKPQNKHIYFHDDEESCKESSQQESISHDVQALHENDPQHLSNNDAEGSSSKVSPNVFDQRKFEMEDYSEKDDSTDDEDIYFSAEEDYSPETEEKKERKLKALPKRRRKRQSKKKSISYPQEMIDNPIIKKFWRRRYSLFSKFDEGIKMDVESWYSVTPEKIAINIAERCQCDLVVDAFCGAGGNAIQLAFTCERVIAIDIDPHKIELARHNARLYGVEDRIEFVVGDYLQLAPSLAADVVFLSPPWGGPSYNKHNVFPLSALLPVSGQKMFKLTTAITENIALYLPKNINTHELVECAGPGGSVEVVQNFLDRELVAVTAYFGELVNSVE